MKKLSFILFLSLTIKMFGSEIVVPTATTTIFYGAMLSTNLSSTNVYSQTLTNNHAAIYSLHHTFQFFYTALGSNSCTETLFSTIDNTNFVPEYTNTIAANYGSTNAAEYTATTKVASYQLRTTVLTSNASLTFNYMAE